MFYYMIKHLQLDYKMGINTEKPMTKQESKKQGVVGAIKQKIDLAKVPVEKKTDEKKDKQLTTGKVSEPKDEVKPDYKNLAPKGVHHRVGPEEGGASTSSPSRSERSPSVKEDINIEDKKKKPIQKKPVVKKTEAVVNARSLPISTKYSMAICRFIKNKKIGKAIVDLGQVITKKKAVPMKGEIPHKKGRGMMSGRYPKKASEHFIEILKSLQANANANEIENPRIVEAVANLASRPYGRFGRIRKKRTHVKLVAKNKLNKEKENRK